MLPKNLQYGSKVNSAPASSYRSNIAPQNGTGPYQLGDTIILNIPTQHNLVMCPTDSYLKWTVQPFSTVNANAIRWDKCGSHGLIQRISIYHGSNLLQQIDSYGLLAKLMFDLQSPTDANYNKQNVMCGTRSDLVVQTNAVPLTAAAITYAGVAGNLAGNTVGNIETYIGGVLGAFNNGTVPASYLPAQQITSGEPLISSATGVAVTNANDTTQAVTYCLNLISLIGSLCPNNYLPLFAMTSAPLRVEIQLVSQDIFGINAVAATTHATGLVSNVEFIASMIQLGDSAMGMISQSLEGQPLQFVYGDYRNFQGTYQLTTATTTQYNFPIPAKYASLKSLFVCQRDKLTGSQGYFPFSCVNYGLQTYQWRIGPKTMPSKPVDDVVSMYSELLKAGGVISDLRYCPSIRKSSYLISASTANTLALEANSSSNVISGSFYVGIDLENYIGSSKDQFFAGMNTQTDDIFFQGYYNTNTVANGGTTNFSGAVLPTANIRFDAFALFDCVFVCENGVAFVRY